MKSNSFRTSGRLSGALVRVNRLHGIRKQKRDRAVKEFEFQHPHYSEAEVGNAFGLHQSTISRILKKEKSSIQ